MPAALLRHRGLLPVHDVVVDDSMPFSERGPAEPCESGGAKGILFVALWILRTTRCSREPQAPIAISEAFQKLVSQKVDTGSEQFPLLMLMPLGIWALVHWPWTKGAGANAPPHGWKGSLGSRFFFR